MIDSASGEASDQFTLPPLPNEHTTERWKVPNVPNQTITLKTDRRMPTCLLMARRAREEAAATEARIAYPRDRWDRTILFFKTELR